MSPDVAVVDRTTAGSESDLGLRLDEGLAALGLSLSRAARGQLIAFLALLQQWNRVYNLTSVRDPADMLTVHLLDALAILPIVEDALGNGNLLDVGSGAGLPGIPLAIARPAWTIHSVDAVAKKIGFQTRARQALHLSDFHPHHGRVEALTLAEKPAVIVARAYASLLDLVTTVAHLTDERTTIVAMKGASPTAEIALLPPTWCVSKTTFLDVPFLGAERCAVLLRRA